MGLKNRLFRYHFPETVAANAIRLIPPASGVVLMYHEVLPDDIALPAWTIVKESDFRWQVRYLQTHFDVVTMDQALERVTSNSVAKRPFAVVTFDDGYKGNLDIVLPEMDSLGLPFTLYVATQAVIEKKLFWYDRIINLLNAPEDIEVRLLMDGQAESFRIPRRGGEIRRWKEIQKLLTRLKEKLPAERESTVNSIMDEHDGLRPGLEMLSSENLQRLAKSSCVTIGSHTHRHELLDQLEAEDIRETLQTANNHISRITGFTPRHFAYPNGNFNQCVKDQVREAGYETAVTTMPGIWSTLDSLMEIPRINIGRFDTKGHFKALVSGYL